MQQAAKNRLFNFPLKFLILGILPYSVVFATAYTNPGNATAPLTLNTGDTFTNNSSVFQSTGTAVSSFGTIQVNADSSGNTITLNAGTITATGTSTGPIATIPIYGLTTSSTTLNMATGSVITNNSTQTSTVAMNFTGPILFTKSGGTITGTITAGAGSLFSLSGGTTTSDITLGASSIVNLSSAIVAGTGITGILTVGAGSTINLSGSASIAGGIVGNASALRFAIGSFTPPTTLSGISRLTVNSGTFTLSSGAGYQALTESLAVASGATLTLGFSLAASAASTINNGTLTLNVVNALPTGTFTNAGTLNLGAALTLPNVSINTGTIAAGTNAISNVGTFTNFGNITGATTFTNSGTMYYSGGTVSTVTLANNGNLNVGALLTPAAFSNTGGSIFIVGATGSRLEANIPTGVKLYYGQNSDGITTNLNATYTQSNTVTGVPIIRVFNGSNLIVNSAISGVTTSFTIDKNATLALNATLAGTGGTFNNAGLTTISASINGVTGPFVNSGTFNVATAWTPGSHSSVTNTGDIYLPSAGSITLPALGLNVGGTLSLGRTSAGANSNTAFTANTALTIPAINIYNSSTLTGTAAVNSNIYLLGTQTNPFTGNVAGSMLTIGQDAFGNTSTPVVTLTSAVTGFPTVYVNSGSTLTTSGAGTFSNVNIGLYVYTNATLNIGASFTGSAISGTNSGTINVTSTFGQANFTNSTGGVLNLNNGTVIPATPTISVINNLSTGSGSNPGINISGTASNLGVINNFGTLRYQGTLNGTGTISNKSGGVITFDSAASNANSISNLSGGSIVITTNTANTGTITNAGTMTATSVTLSGVGGSIINQSTGILNLAGVTNTTQAINNAGTFNITGTSTQSAGAITNSGTLNLFGTLGGTGSITNASGGKLIFNNAINNLSALPAITNQANGTITIAGLASTNNANISNSGTMNISTALNGSAGNTITNNSGGTITFSGTPSLGNALTNSLNGTVAFNASTSMGGIVTNNGAMTISNDIGFTGASNGLSSSGAGSSVRINGNVMLTSVGATTYTNSALQIMTVTNPDEFDSLITSGATNLSGATLQIIPYITETNGQPQSYTLITANPLTPPSAYSGITSDFYRIFEVNVGINTLVLTVTAEEVTVPINVEIADVLQDMFANTTNSGQQTLENAFLSVDRDLNESLHQMIPISNAYVYENKMQGVVFNKVETRLAGLRDGWDNGVIHKGIIAGDLLPGSSVWISASGSLTEQGEDDEDDGYNAKTGVFLLGRDFLSCDNVWGLAGGYSYTHLKELSNAGFINNISRWHAMGYGSYNFARNNYWDWLVTTNFNMNNSHRDIFVSGNNFTVYGKFHAYQLAAKIARGKGYDFFESYRFTPFTFMQYSFVHQDAYSESGSVAALAVEAVNKNVLTLGLGTKFDFPMDAWHCIGMRELRAAVVYDVVNNHNNTTANFVVGSDSFTVTSTPVRLGLQLGAGISFEIVDHLVFELDYDFEVRSHFTDNTGLVKFKYVF